MTNEVVATQAAIFAELEAVVAANLERHLETAKPWMPHEYVPWGLGKTFARLGGADWAPSDSNLHRVACTAIVVSLLTEDNLPSYHRDISLRFGRRGAWGEWIGRWTAEEGRHSIALRDYLVVTRAVDPALLEQQRMAHVCAGYDAGAKSPLEGLVYVALQELATRVSHRNTGRASGCATAESLLSRISNDENLHMIFYRDLVAVAFELDPGATMRAVYDEVVGFEMPGRGMRNFEEYALEVALAGIYDLGIHQEEVVRPLLRFWSVFERSDLRGEGERLRECLASYVDAQTALARRFTEQRARLALARGHAPRP